MRALFRVSKNDVFLKITYRLLPNVRPWMDKKLIWHFINVPRDEEMFSKKKIFCLWPLVTELSFFYSKIKYSKIVATYVRDIFCPVQNNSPRVQFKCDKNSVYTCTELRIFPRSWSWNHAWFMLLTGVKTPPGFVSSFKNAVF